jgi:hypothetical protein
VLLLEQHKVVVAHVTRNFLGLCRVCLQNRQKRRITIY